MNYSAGLHFWVALNFLLEDHAHKFQPAARVNGSRAKEMEQSGVTTVANR